jgi:transcriptional regulator NrdR family protein
MKCYFCGSDDLTIRETRSKGESVTVSQMVTEGEGIMELVKKPVKVSATRRKVKCNACNRYFWTVEHFESSTKRTDIQEQLLSDDIVIGDIHTELPPCQLSAEEKEKLTKLIQENYL